RVLPERRTQAPLVSLDQAGEAVLRHRRRQVVADCGGERQELVGHHDTDDVQAGIVAAVLAATRSVVARQGVERAQLQLLAEHIQLAHLTIEARMVAACSTRESVTSPATRTSARFPSICRTVRLALM